MSLTALLCRLLIISSNQRPLCSIHTMISPCSSQVVSFEYVAFQVTHTCECSRLSSVFGLSQRPPTVRPSVGKVFAVNGRIRFDRSMRYTTVRVREPAGRLLVRLACFPSNHASGSDGGDGGAADYTNEHHPCLHSAPTARAASFQKARTHGWSS